jgi:hypothetical protein
MSCADRDEIRTGLTELGVKLSDEEMNGLMYTLDDDGTVTVHTAAAVACWSSRRIVLTGCDALLIFVRVNCARNR